MTDKRAGTIIASGGLFGVLVLTVFALVVAMVRSDSLPLRADASHLDVFLDATFDGRRAVDGHVPSAVALLTEAGFDGPVIAERLLLAGVPSSVLALPDFAPADLSEGALKERGCLAEAIYHEARNQPVIGRLAVADVILNRVADKRFPDSICRVVYQRRTTGCQFSFVCDGSLERGREPAAWRKAEALADLVYRGFQPPLTRFATFYHADYVSPYWAALFDRTTVIGDHVFYRPKGALRLAANQLGVDLGRRAAG